VNNACKRKAYFIILFVLNIIPDKNLSFFFCYAYIIYINYLIILFITGKWTQWRKTDPRFWRKMAMDLTKHTFHDPHLENYQ